jgi:peptidoglycan hydrolase-like protein with peptidoglycan-binding domain
VSAHLRRRGRHAVPKRPVFVAPAAGTLGPAALGLALTAGVIGSPPGSSTSPVELLSARQVGTPITPLGLADRIEAFAAYVPQSRCDPSAKAGVLAFERLVRATYPNTGTDGIVRACNIGGTSEHKEGRAWDWKVSAYDRYQRAEANALFHWLFATDEEGHRAAMARRLGIMYVVWNRHIWRAYNAGAGWQPYHGAEAHTDHAHFSFSWAGALKKTSYWHASGHGRISQAQLRRFGHSVVARGARGDVVRIVQRALGVRATGVFGSKTQAAVIKFQRTHRLSADGVVGPRTWRTLAGPAPRPKPARPRAPHIAPAATPYRRDVVALQHSSRRVLRSSARGPAVETVQRVLRLRTDGVYGPQTVNTVARWQHRHHLVPDGVVGPATWRAMIAATQRAEAHAIAVARARAAAIAHARAVARARQLHAQLAAYRHMVLRPGATGPAVRFLQQRLRVHADGLYGPRTGRALRAFQLRHHLAPDGVVGARTWRALG